MSARQPAPEADFGEIAAALGVSKQAVQKRSIKGNWPYREKDHPGGKKRLFALDTLPPDVKKAVTAARLRAAVARPVDGASLVAAGSSSPATLPGAGAGGPAPVFSAAEQTDAQRLARDARQVVVDAIRRLRAEAGCSQEAALHTLLTTAANGQASAMVVNALRRARDGRGRKGAADNGLPAIRTLKRWLTAPDLTPQVPRSDLSVPAWAKDFLACYQQPQKPSVEAAYQTAFNARADRPSIHQVRHFLDKLGKVTRERGRMGPRELKTIRPYITRSFDDLEPNDIWCADGHTFDAEVQHPFHGRPFRPEITSIIDVATRRLVGWSVALSESGTAVLDALRHAGEFAGLCAIFYVDNGSGYDNDLIKAEGTGLAGRMGFEVRHSIAYNSQARGVIERLHQTVWVAGAKLLPSYIGAAMDREAKLAQFKVTRQAIRKGGAMPLLPWDVFLAFCRERVADYNARPHRSLKGVSPDLRWREFELRGWTPHRLAAADFDTMYRPRVLRTIRRGRVDLFTNYYSALILEEFHGDRVQVAYDLHKVDQVWIYTPEGRYIGTAEINGNTRRFYPVAVTEQAREARAESRAKRVTAKLTEIREELHGPALPAPGPNEIVIAGPAIKVEAAVEMARVIESRPAPTPAKPAQKPRSERPIAEVVDEWLGVDALLAAGEAVDDDLAYWHGSVQQSPAWKAEMKRRLEESGADGRRAAV